MTDNATTRLRDATDALVTAALRLSAYGTSVATTGAGQRDTMRNMVADVEVKANAARAALRDVG